MAASQAESGGGSMVSQLLYFPLRARAEPIRMIANYNGFKYTDKIVQFSEWADLKPTLPEGQVPVLVREDGTFMPETWKICKFVAENGTLPIVIDDEGIALLKESQNKPLSMCMPLLNFFPKSDIHDKLVDFLKSALKIFKNYETKLSDKDFFAGSSVGIGDFAVFFLCGVIISLKGDFFEGFTDNFKNWITRMRELPGLKEYLDDRPKCGTGQIGKEGTIAFMDKRVEI